MGFVFSFSYSSHRQLPAPRQVEKGAFFESKPVVSERGSAGPHAHLEEAKVRVVRAPHPPPSPPPLGAEDLSACISTSRALRGAQDLPDGAPSPVPADKATAPHSSTPARKIPWTEEPGGLQSMGSLGVGHDWTTSLSLFTFICWRRKWQPTAVLLPGESQGRGSLVGCVYGVAQSRTRLKRLSSSSSSSSPHPCPDAGGPSAGPRCASKPSEGERESRLLSGLSAPLHCDFTLHSACTSSFKLRRPFHAGGSPLDLPGTDAHLLGLLLLSLRSPLSPLETVSPGISRRSGCSPSAFW